LPQKTKIVFEKEAQIVDSKFQHGNSLDSHPKSKTAHLVGIVPDHLEDLRVNHSGPQNFQPSGLRTNPASLSTAHYALDVHFRTGFGEGEKAGSEAQGDISAEHLMHKDGQNPLEIAEGDVVSDH